MDARLPVVFALPFVLAACSSSPKPPEKHPGLKVFEQLIGQPAAPDSIVRWGDRITYVVAPTAEKPWFARFFASCTPGSGSMFYKTERGMKPFTEKFDSNNLPLPQMQVLQHSEQLRQACAYRPTPDWRALDVSAGEDWLVLDRNSAVHEDGLLKIWTGKQLAQYQVGSEITLISQWQERLAIDCAQRMSKRLSQVSVGSDGEAYGVHVNHDSEMLPVAQASSERRLLVEAACQPPETLARLAVPPARKPLAPQLETPTAAPAVLAAIQALNLPEPRLTLQTLEYRYDALMFQRVQVNDVQREDVFTRDPQSGQLLVRPTDSMVGTSLRLTLRGLIDLANRTFDRQSGEQVKDYLDVTGLSFEGNWQQLPENSKVLYHKTQTKKGTPFTSTVSCTIGTALPANRINPELQGMAKPLTCSTVKPAIKGTERFNYLEDYGVFVQEEQNSVLGLWKWRVNAIR